MKLRSLLLVAALIGLVLGLNNPAQAATKYDGHVTASVPASWLGVVSGIAGAGPDTISGELFARACQSDRARGGTAAIDAFLGSPFNGIDAWVVDLKKEKMGAFSVKGPGAAPIGPEVDGIQLTSYDMDLDFWVDPAVDASKAAPAGCLDANEKATGNTSHKCYSHKETPDEKTACISGYKDAKGKTHGARYAMVSSTLNLKGPFNFTLTTP